MAKRTPTTTSRTASKKPVSSRRSSAAVEDSNYEADTESNYSAPKKSAFSEFIANPAVRYVAGGIATAVLTRIATNLAAKYPEISRFVSENLDGVEGRLAEFKNGLNNTQDSVSKTH